MSSIKPVLRKATYDTRRDLNNLVEEWVLENADKIKRSCASCLHAQRNGPFSCKRFSAVPPVDVIINGCDGYEDFDEIPF